MSGRKGVELQESEQYVMRARGTTLTIRNIKQDDGGSYTCKASNKAGDVQREIFLKVFGEDNSFFLMYAKGSFYNDIIINIQVVVGTSGFDVWS